MKNLLVLGVGNILLSDDGVGVHAVRKLMKENWPAQVTLLDAGTSTQDIFYIFDKYDAVLVLDIVHAGLEPGTCRLWSERELVENASQRLSVHDIDLLDSLRMAQLFSGHRPQVQVVGMEPNDFTTWNMGLSPAVARNMGCFLNMARQQMRAYVKQCHLLGGGLVPIESQLLQSVVRQVHSVLFPAVQKWRSLQGQAPEK